jgi:hypothetical protein
MARVMTADTSRGRPTRASRRGAALLAALMVTIQAFALVHFVIQPHFLDATAGTIVHPAGTDAGRQQPGTPSKPHPGEECQVLATLGQATTLPTLNVSVASASASWDLVPGTPDGCLVPSQRERYLLAPAQSPPL